MTADEIRNLSVEAIKVTGVMQTPDKTGCVDAVISVKKTITGKNRDVFAVKIGDMTLKLPCYKVMELLVKP